mmetsp:Transcript_20872/g.50428  ORF Transcript_20872/g.50428 Transcript_20872/m.50428 type:complete len:245 (-) Transcript_20872:2731-3465(-)
MLARTVPATPASSSSTSALSSMRTAAENHSGALPRSDAVARAAAAASSGSSASSSSAGPRISSSTHASAARTPRVANHSRRFATGSEIAARGKCCAAPSRRCSASRTVVSCFLSSLRGAYDRTTDPLSEACFSSMLWASTSSMPLPLPRRSSNSERDRATLSECSATSLWVCRILSDVAVICCERFSASSYRFSFTALSSFVRSVSWRCASSQICTSRCACALPPSPSVSRRNFSTVSWYSCAA